MTFRYACLKAFSRFWERLFVAGEVVGRQHLPRPPYLLCPSHISHADYTAMMLAHPGKLDVVGMNTLFHGWLGRFWAWLIDPIPVERFAPDLSTVVTAKARLRAGRVVLMFPERGIRSGATSVLGGVPLPPGAGGLAQIAKVPVVPAVVLGTDRPYGARSWFLRPRVIVAFGPPLHVNRRLPSQASRTDLDRRLERAIRNLYHALLARPDVGEELIPRTAQERQAEA